MRTHPSDQPYPGLHAVSFISSLLRILRPSLRQHRLHLRRLDRLCVRLPELRLASLVCSVLLLAACVPNRSPVTAFFVHRSFSASDLSQGNIALYGYRGIDGTVEQRRAFDRQLRVELGRAFPKARVVPPEKVKGWLWESEKALLVDSALNHGPEALPYEDLEPLSAKSRYFMWATVTRDDQREWRNNDEDEVDYCVAWRFRVRYALADLQLRRLVAETQIDIDDQECRTNSRSNTVDDAPNLGAGIVRFFWDVAVDTAVDGVRGTYPEAPSSSEHLTKSAAYFFERLRR